MTSDHPSRAAGSMMPALAVTIGGACAFVEAADVELIVELPAHALVDTRGALGLARASWRGDSVILITMGDPGAPPTTSRVLLLSRRLRATIRAGLVVQMVQGFGVARRCAGSSGDFHALGVDASGRAVAFVDVERIVSVVERTARDLGLRGPVGTFDR